MAQQGAAHGRQLRCAPLPPVSLDVGRRKHRSGGDRADVRRIKGSRLELNLSSWWFTSTPPCSVFSKSHPRWHHRSRMEYRRPCRRSRSNCHRQLDAAPLQPESASLPAAERAHIQGLLDTHQGHRARVAAALGITERTLYRKLKQYGLGR
ncbi:MAG: hypothetical protein J0J07_10150 [Thiobacillus sp.]|nr:hypothetical protein [Thiobacillus sp.]